MNAILICDGSFIYETPVAIPKNSEFRTGQTRRLDNTTKTDDRIGRNQVTPNEKNQKEADVCQSAKEP